VYDQVAYDTDDTYMDFKGDLCWPNPTWGFDIPDEPCSIVQLTSFIPVHYADEVSGIPFVPEIKAKRYIVVRMADNSLYQTVIAPYIDTNMLYMFVPANSYKAEKINKFANPERPAMHNAISWVSGKGGELNFFVKNKD